MYTRIPRYLDEQPQDETIHAQDSKEILTVYVQARIDATCGTCGYATDLTILLLCPRSSTALAGSFLFASGSSIQPLLLGLEVRLTNHRHLYHPSSRSCCGTASSMSHIIERQETCCIGGALVANSAHLLVGKVDTVFNF